MHTIAHTIPMIFQRKTYVSGEHTLSMSGKIGALEGILSVPEGAEAPYLALLGHPHSLQGGSMHNKVVTTLARVFRELNIPSVRFNFRGVGASAGAYDNGIGESDDMLLLANAFQAENPHMRLMFAGFSFGSYVAYRSAAQSDSALLITVAPPVHHYDYKAFTPPPNHWIIVQGEEDEITPLSLVLEFVKDASHSIELLRFAKTGHFFHGKLIELKSRLLDTIRPLVTHP